MRFGLCCLFKQENISFRTTTAKALLAMNRSEQLLKLSGICHDNARNLLRAVHACHDLGIGAFRIMSPLFPRMTHPEVGYGLADLPSEAVLGPIRCGHGIPGPGEAADRHRAGQAAGRQVP